MATLPTLAAGDVDTTNSDHEGQTSATAPLQEIGSASDTSYIFEGTNRSLTSTAYLALENMPTDFETMDTLSFQYRAFADQVTANKTLDSISIQIFQFDRSTALTNASTVNYIGGLSNTTPTNSGVFSLTGVDTTSAKSVWDGAVVAISFTVSRSMGGNQDEYRISAFELTGTYTQRTPTAPTSRTLSAVSANSNKVDLSWNADTAAYPAPTYTIEKSTDGTNFTTHATGVTSQDDYRVTGLTNDQLYYFKITGTNTAGSAVSNTASATPSEFVRENTLEGGTDEAEINSNAGQSGPDSFDIFYNGNAVVYDTARAKSGTVSMRAEKTGGSLTSSAVGWDCPNNLDNLYIRFYMYITAYPSNNAQEIVSANEVSSSFSAAFIQLNTNGTLSIHPRSRASASTTSTVAQNQWVRVEASFSKDSNVDCVVKLYNNPDSTTPTDTATALDYSNFTYIDNIVFGIWETSTAYGPYWIDSVKVSDEDWVGPESTASTSFQGKLGDLTVSKMYLGDLEVTGGYLGDIDLWA